MKKLMSVVLVLSLAACGQEPAKTPAPPPGKTPVPVPEAPKGPASDPTGKYKCLKCSTTKEDYKTSEKKCPRCGEVLAADETPKPKPEHAGTPGKTSVSVSYACGNAKCKWTTPNKSSGCMDCDAKCEKEVWYSCAACKVEKADPSNCEKCKGATTKILK